MTQRPPTTQRSRASELCQRCGLCCNGSLFTFLPVTQAEAEPLRALQARVLPRKDGRLALMLPCAVLKGTCCSAYQTRPARCREYFCELVKAVDRDERPFEAATAIIDEAKARLDELAAKLPPQEASDSRSVLQRAHQVEARAPDDATFMSVRATARDIEAMLRHYFVGPY